MRRISSNLLVSGSICLHMCIILSTIRPQKAGVSVSCLLKDEV